MADKRSSPPPPKRPKYIITTKVPTGITHTSYPSTSMVAFYDGRGGCVGTVWFNPSRTVNVYPT